MWDRAHQLRCIDAFCHLSRSVDHKCELEAKKLASSALGDNTYYIIGMRGRIQIDVMKAIQNNAAIKLEKYSLDSVASTFMRGSISKVEKVKGVQDTYRVVTKSTDGLQSGTFVSFIEDNGLLEDKYGEGKKFQIFDVKQDSFLIKEPFKMSANCKYSWSENKDDISVNEIFACMKGTADDRAKVAKYCVQDCELVGRLLDKLDILSNSIAMANVCLVPLSFIFLRGQGIKCFSLVADECRKDGILIPIIKALPTFDINAEDNDEWTKEALEGAIVLEPKVGLYYEPISVSDFSSLYPSSIIAQNLSHDSLVTDAAFDNLPEREYVTVSYDNYEFIYNGNRIVKGEIFEGKFNKVINKDEPVVHSRFVQPRKDESGNIIDASRGIIPRILMKLLKTRKDIKKRMSIEQDPFKAKLLDAAQQAVKITANSLYGQCGASTSPIRCRPVAASTTATGRKVLLFARDYMIEHYGAEAIYGVSLLDYVVHISQFKIYK